MARYMAFWGKARSLSSAGPRWHPNAYHSLDVAAAAEALLTAGVTRPPPYWNRGEHVLSLVSLIALHDIGKFTRTFQGKVRELWPACLGPYAQPRAGWPHDAAGYALLSGALAERLVPLFGEAKPFSRWLPILRAIAGHHGRPPVEAAHDIPRDVACATCVAAAGEFIDAMLAALEPPPLPALDREARATLAWWLAGLTTLADWIGSSRVWFPPVAADASADLRSYWREVARPRAEQAVAASGLLPSPLAPAAGMAQLFPEIGDAIRPLQRWADATALPDGPVLFVIEDATGAGKTEAALALAQRLMAAGHGRGLYFALPTMATANAMYDRLERAYARLFATQARPSLVLAHGRRMLNPRFAGSILAWAAGAGFPEEPEPADQRGAAQCAAWIADDRRKAFLAEIGVGTIDQALLAVLPSRHAMLRLLGLSQRVLIVDEAHAYDTYQGEELMRLLRFQAGLGGSAIVLSATLTAERRAALCDAFRAGLRLAPAPAGNDAYPLATTASAAGVSAAPVALAPCLARRVEVERLADEDAAAEAIVQAARAGAAVAWVRNAVDDAIEAAGRLRARGLDPLLFHARFAMGDRLAIERRVLAMFGPNSEDRERHGKVVVATQVIEQSLDLDFDLMVSDLAPADLVIQRAGRVWRHPRARPVAGPRLLLLAPEPVADPPEGWLGAALRRTGFVYVDHALLWRSARALLAAGAIVTPDNIRALVEAAYDRDAADAEPAGLARATRCAEAERLTARGVAWQNLLDFARPYERAAGLWEPDIRTPTRLGDPQVILRLARIAGGRVVPWCEDEDVQRAWALSEVSVRADRIEAAAPDEADALVTAAKAQWPEWDRGIPVVVLRPGTDQSAKGSALDRRGRAVRLTYSKDQGLVSRPPRTCGDEPATRGAA